MLARVLSVSVSHSDLILLRSCKLLSIRIDSSINAFSLVRHLVGRELSAALRTLYFGGEPVQNALVVERVSSVAREGRHLVAGLEV